MYTQVGNARARFLSAEFFRTKMCSGLLLAYPAGDGIAIILRSVPLNRLRVRLLQSEVGRGLCASSNFRSVLEIPIAVSLLEPLVV